MMIESASFGAIAIGGTTYEHDVIIRLPGEVVKPAAAGVGPAETKIRRKLLAVKAALPLRSP
jgi:hypothetical protein